MTASTRHLYTALVALLRVVLSTAPPTPLYRACRMALVEAERALDCHNSTIA